MQNCDPETWDKEYKDLFFGDPKQHEARREAQRRIAPSQPGQRGSLNIVKKEAKPVGDMSQFFGRAGDAGRADPNKAAIREIAEAKRKPAFTIAPDGDGDLSISSNDSE
jgi:hypothetical protein